VIATTSTAAKAERLRALGAAEVIDYTADPSWGRTARGLTDDGVEAVVEVGGAGTLAQSLKAVRVGGTVALIGVLGGTKEPVDVLPILMSQIRVQGVFVGSRSGLTDLCNILQAPGLDPVIDRVFPVEAATEAVAWFAERRHVGKVCLTWSEQAD
jgi:NADPH:quinone reductase-like Zn-dependent oxidoreductase